MARYTNTDWPETIWVARHGQSAGNVARDAAEAGNLALIDLQSRDADTPLSDLGREQSTALGHWFASPSEKRRPDVLIASPFSRARETMNTIATSCGVDLARVQIDERLREKEFGILDRLTKRGVGERFPELAAQRTLVGKFYFRPPGGESWCDVILRLRSVVEELRRDYVGRRVLIVSHQVVVNRFRYLLEQLDERAILDIDSKSDVPNCGVTEYTSSGTGDDRRLALTRANFVVPLLDAGAPVTLAPDRPTGPK